jgi:hypothetical protein
VAQKIRFFFVDDLDGSKAEGTVRFGLDGTEYEIDLNAGHAEQLRMALSRYAGAARKVTGTARQPGGNGRWGAGNWVSTSDIRVWAKAQGLEIKDRGRVPTRVIAEYVEAIGKQGPEPALGSNRVWGGALSDLRAGLEVTKRPPGPLRRPWGAG